MKKKALSDSLGSVFRLRPNPIVKKNMKPIKESVNSWTFVAFPDQKTLILQHNHSDYRIEIPGIHVRGHEPPDMIVIRGQVFLDDGQQFSFEPFTEGMAVGDPAELVEDPMNRESRHLYATLKPHEGKEVTIRFPKGKDETVHFPVEAILQEVTPHFAKVSFEELRITMASGRLKPVTIPGQTKTIALAFIMYEEDDERERRPRLVIDNSHWGT